MFRIYLIEKTYFMNCTGMISFRFIHFQVYGRFVKNIIFLLSFLAISVGVMQIFFPAQSAYFQERLLSVKQEGKNEQNVDIMLIYVMEAGRIADENNPFTGAGMNRRYYTRMNAIGAWIADSTIPYFLVHTGWVGVVLIFGIVLIFFADSFFLFLKTGDWLTGYLCAFFLVVFISSLIIGGEALTGSVWVMINFALYAVIKFERWKPEEEEELVASKEYDPLQSFTRNSSIVNH
jgi:hypothetical protein